MQARQIYCALLIVICLAAGFHPVPAVAGNVSQYGYTGREPDTSGLMYYRARYYDPAIGRFLQRDPLGMATGYNDYAYAADDPANRVDPRGLTSRINLCPWDKACQKFPAYQEPGVNLVTAHGNNDAVFAYPRPEAAAYLRTTAVRLDPLALSRILLADPHYEPDKPVRIIACYVGNSSQFCQDLANQLQTTAMCYSEPVFIDLTNSFRDEHPILSSIPFSSYLFGTSQIAVATTPFNLFGLSLGRIYTAVPEVFEPNGPPADLLPSQENDLRTLINMLQQAGAVPTNIQTYQQHTVPTWTGERGPSTPGPSGSR